MHDVHKVCEKKHWAKKISGIFILKHRKVGNLQGNYILGGFEPSKSEGEQKRVEKEKKET